MRTLLLLLAALPVFGACSGSGITWTCPSGATVADVQSAVNSATDGATITFADTGTFTWNSSITLSNSKGITLICATVRGCTVATNNTPITMSTYPGSTNTKLYRISGFVWNKTVASFLIWWGAGCTGCTGTFTQVRVDHNTFNVPAGADMVVFGENSSVTNAYGLIDNNIVNAAGNAKLLYMIASTNSSPPASPIGTINNMFVEDNTMTVTTMDNAGEGCTDGWGTDAIVWRHNTTTNCLVTSHGVLHGGGPQNFELYNNTITVNGNASGFLDCYRCFHHQGSGEFIAFNNLFTAFSGKNSNALEMTHYRSAPPATSGAADPPGQCEGLHSNPADGNRATTATNRGYPCWHQPGRDFAGTLMPMYAWNNKWSDTSARIDMIANSIGGSPDYFLNHLVNDRDYYNAVGNVQTNATTPFNGTTGMGFGTLANRPTTCSVGGTQAADAGFGGVGYFATDVGSQGTLYQCATTNTWTVWYTPFTYPHPLQGSTALPSSMQGGAKIGGGATIH